MNEQKKFFFNFAFFLYLFWLRNNKQVSKKYLQKIMSIEGLRTTVLDALESTQLEICVEISQKMHA